MNAQACRAAILVTFAIAAACAPRARVADTTPRPAEKLAELWQYPQDLAARDLFMVLAAAMLRLQQGSATPGWRPIQRATAPATKSAVPTAACGRSSSGRKRKPRSWRRVCCGRSAITSRATYYVANWQLAGGPGGQQQGGRFRLESEDAEVVGDWSWSDNEFIGTQPYHGLIVTNILLNSWDWKTPTTRSIASRAGSLRASGTLCATLARRSARPRLPVSSGSFPIPVRGFGQGSRNNIDDFESQGFIKRIDERRVDFDFRTIYGLGDRSRATLRRALDGRAAQSHLRRAVGCRVQRRRLQPRGQGALHPEDQSEDC